MANDRIDLASEASEAFNVISYDKGGSVLSMIRKVLGEDVFNEGIKVSKTSR